MNRTEVWVDRRKGNTNSYVLVLHQQTEDETQRGLGGQKKG